MATKRSDSWNENKDQLLLETVLEHITTGSTQLKAFEEAGKKIGKTAGACGFRWNNYLRKKNKQLIEIAKKGGDQAKSKESQTVEQKKTTSTSVQKVPEKKQHTSKKLSVVVNIKSRTEQLLELVQTLETELDSEKSNNEELEEKYEQLKKEYDEVMSFMSKFVKK